MSQAGTLQMYSGTEVECEAGRRRVRGGSLRRRLGEAARRGEQGSRELLDLKTDASIDGISPLINHQYFAVQSLTTKNYLSYNVDSIGYQSRLLASGIQPSLCTCVIPVARTHRSGGHPA